jgi:hypothetical protein
MRAGSRIRSALPQLCREEAGSVVNAPAMHPRLDWHLKNWAWWHRNQRDTDHLDCKTESLWAGNYDNERETNAADVHQAEQVEAIINSDRCPAVPDGFDEVERCALHYMHLGTAVYRMNREPLDVVYDRARARLNRWLLAKGIP